MNLVFSNGIYTSFLLYGVLKQNYEPQSNVEPHNIETQNNVFVLYLSKKNNILIEQNKNILNQLFNTKKSLLWQNYKTFFSFKVNKFKADIGNVSGVEEIKNIYLPINSSSVKLHKELKKVYPQSNFIFYEEGLLSYIRPVFNKHLRQLLIKYKSFFVGYDILNNYLKHFLPNACISIINKSYLLQAIDIIKVNIKISNNSTKKYCILLPQYYYISSKKKFTELVNLYKIEINNLKQLGYEIVIKEHPKTSVKISNLLQEVEVLNSDTPLIIEQLMPNLKIDLVFSVYSTSLLSLSYFFNINAISSKAMLNQRINYYSFYPTLSALLINNLFYSLNYGIINKEKKADIKDIFKSNNKLFNFFIYIKAKI
jgi:hypothetical protein